MNPINVILEDPDLRRRGSYSAYTQGYLRSHLGTKHAILDIVFLHNSVPYFVCIISFTGSS